MAQRFWQLGLVVILALGMGIAAAQRLADGGVILFPATTGDSVFLRSATGTRTIVDCGNDAPALLSVLGTQRPLLATGVADLLILTTPGAAWQGGCPALIAHGISELWFLPVVADHRRSWCDPPIRCVTLTPGVRIVRDELQYTVVDACSLRVDWPGGALWIAHGCRRLGASGDWPANGVRIVAMPWVVDPQRQTLRPIAPTHIIYRSGMRSDTPYRATFARTPGGYGDPAPP